jgi:hypothetical protein
MTVKELRVVKVAEDEIPEDLKYHPATQGVATGMGGLVGGYGGGMLGAVAGAGLAHLLEADKRTGAAIGGGLGALAGGLGGGYMMHHNAGTEIKSRKLDAAKDRAILQSLQG